MKLRTRLLLGYGYLAFLVLLVAGLSTVGFFELSKGIRSILVENFTSVAAAIEMEQALERQDSILLQSLMKEGAVSQLGEHDREFREALAVAADNVTIEGERALVERIETSYEAMLASRAELSTNVADISAYERNVYPSFVATKEAVIELMQLNHAAMVAADEESVDRAARFGLWLGVLVTLALASLIFIARGLREYVVRRLDSMAHVAEAITAGERHLRFAPRHADELGAVAVLLNGTLDRADEYYNRATAVQTEERKLAAALFEKLVEPPAVLLDEGDNVIARVGSLDDVDRLTDDPSAVAEPLRFGERILGRILRPPR